ncbi:MAG: DegT/DnrJ/EryC1/StrS family aminotransferase [Kiritimatiellia bacterium]|jgi:dTDP-4-amino-4,6-dideoxygalactose transaminase|nr:DegT/DnrJ/EryC1/StrS family aminotransferase [Kiritimatiellia bacterium]MDP6631426.1 DegT/DnrJ/EryC1/StrS family aminotransferase [Kiritimatiellia bacterium]MDP6809101.1 DegT/DnrJ/EryC1/StrS family aminotransferase [Kiritimatiellia bacterium]MDP7023207.1 DegT/DnrJ/EryC1/StrS family aminotransferase [Kiritimatiellia bacterium]
MQVPLLDLKAQYAPLREEIRAVIDEVCDAQYFILGPKVVAFEAETAAYCDTKAAIGASSGSDALIISLMALDIGPGDAVITTPYTFFATVGAIARVGATPVFVDIDPVTFNIDPAAIRNLLANWPDRFAGLTPRAIMPVHLYGQCADMDPIMELAKEHDLAVIEDGAQAIGSEYPSASGTQKAGAIGTTGCFSFFPSKNLGGFGDGGLVTTQDEALAEKLSQLRNHGMNPRYYHKMVGGNFRLDAIQAAVLSVKLRHLDEWHASRRKNAATYTAGFEGSAVQTPTMVYADAGVEHPHIFNQFIIRAPNRDAVKAHITEKEIGNDIYYPLCLHMQECFAGLGYEAGAFPVAEKAAGEVLALPVYPELTEEMQDYVVKSVLEAI